jgi:hypothetical protein
VELDLPGHKNSAHHFGGRIGYRCFFYTAEKQASSTLWGYIALLEEEGRAFEPFLLRECNCHFSSSTPIYTSVEEEKI